MKLIKASKTNNERADASANSNATAGGLLTSVFKRNKKANNTADGANITLVTTASAQAPAVDPKVYKALQEKAEALDTENSKLKLSMRNLEAEIVLHKETKDQLSRQVKATQLDIEDQRRLFKASMAELSERNKELTAQLRLAKTSPDIIATTPCDLSMESPECKPTELTNGESSDGQLQPSDEPPPEPQRITQPDSQDDSAPETQTDNRGRLQSNDNQTPDSAVMNGMRALAAQEYVSLSAEVETLKVALLEATQARDILKGQLDRHEEALKHEVTDTEGLREQLRHLNNTIATLQEERSSLKVSGQRDYEAK